MEITERTSEWEEAGGFGGQAEDKVGGDRVRSGPDIGREIGMHIEAEPYETSDAANSSISVRSRVVSLLVPSPPSMTSIMGK